MAARAVCFFGGLSTEEIAHKNIAINKFVRLLHHILPRQGTGAVYGSQLVVIRDSTFEQNSGQLGVCVRDFSLFAFLPFLVGGVLPLSPHAS